MTAGRFPDERLYAWNEQAVRAAIRRPENIEVRALRAGIADRGGPVLTEVATECAVPRLDGTELVALVDAPVVRRAPGCR